MGFELGEGLRKQSLSSSVVKQVQHALKRHPAKSAHLVKSGVSKAMSNVDPAYSEAQIVNPKKEDVDWVLEQLGLSAEEFSTTAQ